MGINFRSIQKRYNTSMKLWKLIIVVRLLQVLTNTHWAFDILSFILPDPLLDKLWSIWIVIIKEPEIHKQHTSQWSMECYCKLIIISFCVSCAFIEIWSTLSLGKHESVRVVRGESHSVARACLIFPVALMRSALNFSVEIGSCVSRTFIEIWNSWEV